MLGQVVDLPVGELDLAVGDQFTGAHVDVIARAAPKVLHEQARFVVAPVVPEPGLLEPVVEVGVSLSHLLVQRNLELMHDPVRQ